MITKNFDELARSWKEKNQLPEEFDTSIRQPVTRQYSVKNGVEIVQCVIPCAETYIPQHSHEYDHITLIPIGGIRVWKDSVLDVDYYAPTMIEIPARVKHTFMSLMPGTVFYCIHRASPTGEIPIHEEHQLPTMVVKGGICKGLYETAPGLHPEDEVL